MKRAFIVLLIVSLFLIPCTHVAFGEAAEASMSAEELRQAGKDAESAKDYEKAMEYYQQAAEKGVAASIYGIGHLYCNGLGVEQSYERAAEYYRQAAEAGLEEAVDELKALVEAGHVSEEYLEGLGE